MFNPGHWELLSNSFNKQIILEQIYIFKKGQIKRIDLYERRAKIENGKQEIQVQFQARQYLKDLQKMHQKIIMQKQQDSLSKSTPSLPLNQILIKTMKQYPPHPTLEPLLNILSQLGGRGNESTRQLQKIINKLCDQILKLNDRPIKVDDFRKEEEVQILFKKFISIEHHKEILVNNKSEPMVIKYRYIISEYFHYLIHYTTLKNITKLCVLFYKFVSLQMLERKIVNFFFLNLILSHENLTLNHDIKYIKMCLRSLYKNNVLHIKATLDQTPQLKKKGQESYPINYHLYSNIKLSSLSFILIAYIIYFGNISSSKCAQQMKSDTDMIQDIVSKPINIVSIVQQFRNQFPKVQVYKCVRDLDSVSQCIVDNYFLKSLFGIYLDYKLNPVHKQYVYNIIENLIKFNLTLHTVKSLIKKLEITDQQNYEQKWKNVFVLLKTTFPNHNKIQQKFRQSKQIPSFTCLEEDEPLRNTELSWTKGLTNANNQQSEVQKLIVEKNTLKFTYFSHLNYTLEHEFNGFFITFKSYRILDWYIILKLKNDQNQLWVTVRHIDQNQFQLQIIKITNGSFTYMTKDQIQWDPFEKHVLECSLEDDQILFKFGTQQISLEQALNEEDFSPSEKKIKQTLKMKNIRPKQIILGANSNDIPNYLTQVSNFEIKYCQGKITYNFIHHNKYKINKISTNVKMVPLESLSLILKKLGQIDLFFLITSHLIRKVENDECLKKMLKQVNDFLQYLVVFKGVSGLKFNQQLRELRFYNVRCLVWLASKSKKDPKIILQILRLLQIRKIKRPIQLLEILSNIGLWKQIAAKSHMLIIDKIKQHCRQAEIQKASQMIDQLKKIILDFNLYYKDSQLFAQNLQEDYLQKHSQILKLIYDVVSNQKISAILDFILFNLKILFIVLDKTKSNDYIDTTIGYELTLLVFRLLYTARQSQFEKAQRQKNKSPGKKTMKMSKLFALSSSRSMNLPLRFGQNDRDDQSHALKIQQILAWIHEILFILKNQVLVTQQKIKYFDWDWDYKLTSTRSTVLIQNKGQQGQKSRQISQTKILTYCQHIQIGLMSFNRNIFNALVMSQLSDAQWQVFWNMNLFDEKISVQRFLDTLKLGNFNKINWDDEKIISVLSKSFDLFDSGSSMRLPSKLVESMKIKDITNIHNTLLGTYLQKSQQNNPLERQKCAQKIMFLIALIPDSLYTNTHLLRQEIRKQKRNIKTVELIQKHLIVKQLAKESFKFINQMKQNENKDKTSTIFSFNDSIVQKEPKISFLDPSDTMNKSDKSESFISNISEINQKKNQQGQKLSVFSNTDYQKSFLESKSQVISTQKIKESLEYYKLLATPNQIQQFYKVTSSNQDKKQVQQQIQGHIINFNISIDAIISILEQSGNIIEKLNQLQNFIFFIEKHIYSFSKMILTEHMFTEVSPPQTQQLRPRRKKSFKSNNYKFKQESDFILDQFLKDRRKSHYRMENIWTNVQKNNKDFWEVFFKSQKKNQCVDQTCNSMKVKGLIKIDHQKRQIQLPKNMTSISNKFSLSGDSDKQLQPEGLSQASIFGDISVYQQQQSFQRQKQDAVSKQNVPINSKDIHLLKRQQKKANQFSVLYITTTKIYQGLMLCGNNTIHFIQDKSPDEGFYEIICANQHERRAANEIQKKRQEFEITLNDKSTIIPKRYLYYDAAVQIYSQRRAYFFVFRKSVKREQFLLLLQNIKGTILNEDHLIQTANKQMQRWMNGDISNYTYLMHLNDLSGRSFNDMSQYYIFPWIITNFKSNKFNKKFISSQNNYRDLSKPVGALNQKRLGQLMSRYRESQKYKEIASYLYGSFCSNPAIVCNYLVRLQPFSMFHYLLQSKQFDLADRIFYSISNQFTCCYSNVGDYKQLIPQFFSAPEFLRNRNKYKFGQKQNKEIVNNVQLPQWALYQFGSTKNSKMADKLQNFQPQQQFVFRMRKCLQSSYVTSNLNNWIDLMFGQYNQKQKAMERQNLYIESLYKNELSKNKNNKNKQTCLIFFKQFGQMPRDLFDKDHKTYKNSRTSYKIGNSEIYSIAELTNQTKVGKKYYADHRFFIYWDENTLNIINIKNKSGLLQKTEYELSQTPTNGQITELKSFNAESHSEDKKNDVKIDFLIYLKDGKVMLREIGVTTFRKKLQIKQQKQSPETLDNKFHILEINQDQKQIILVESNNIQVYNYSLQVNNLQKSGDLSTLLISNQNNWNEQSISIPLGKKIDFKLSLKLEFSQHRSKIEHLKYSNSFGIIISIDSNRKVYVSKLNSKQFQVLQYFRLKKLTHCQSILQMQIHQMGYIYILTSLNIVHMYNLMGDYVAGFSGITLREINKKMQQKIDSRIQANKQIQSKSSIGSKQQKGRKKSGSQIPVGGKFNTFQIQQDQSQIITTGNARSDQNSGSRRESLMDQGPQQIIISFEIWNQESGQIVFGTNFTNFYRVDMFMIDDCEKVSLSSLTKQKGRRKKSAEKMDKNNQDIQFFNVKRIGRHWQCWVASSDELFKMQSEDYRNAQKRNEQYHKKYVLD